jgi:hypothetical protein
MSRKPRTAKREIDDDTVELFVRVMELCSDPKHKLWGAQGGCRRAYLDASLKLHEKMLGREPWETFVEDCVWATPPDYVLDDETEMARYRDGRKVFLQLAARTNGRVAAD